MGYVYLALTLIFLGGGGYGVWAYTSAIKEAERFEEETKVGRKREEQLRATIQLLDDSIRASQKLAADRASRAAKAEEEAGKFKRELEELKNAEPPVKLWANEPIPPIVRRLRGEGAFTPADVPGPDSKPKPNADPTPIR